MSETSSVLSRLLCRCDNLQLIRTLCVPALLVAAVPAAAAFFPLSTGNSWTYKDLSGGSAFTVTVGQSLERGGKVYYHLRGYAEGDVMARVRENGDLVYLDPEGNETVLTPLSAEAGGWQKAPLRMCDQEAQALERRGKHDGPAGPLGEVLEVRYQTLNCADAGVEKEQYADNIGMVRRVVTTIAGPRTYDLVSARVGKVAIDASAYGRFTVTADYQPGSEFMTVVFRLQNAGAPLKLQFSSGQEFDMQLRDARGEALWTWSATRLFLQALHEREVAGEWTVAEMAQLPAGGLRPGSYTVGAWITTMGEHPSFAAVTTVTVEP